MYQALLSPWEANVAGGADIAASGWREDVNSKTGLIDGRRPESDSWQDNRRGIRSKCA
jgi:hypothetical protein